MKKTESSTLVYSTGVGRVCPECKKAVKSCSCRNDKPAPPSDGIVRIRLETKGRGGKGVTLITGVPVTALELETLGKQLKQRCGTGGTVKNGVIEIQGDHRNLIFSELSAMGWTVKRAGG